MDLRQALDRFYYSTALCDLRLMKRKFVDETITYNSLLYLELIFTMEGRCTASRLADMLHVSRPGVTSKVNELIRRGLVTKTPDPEDGRRYFLSVNEEAVPRYQVYRRQDGEVIRRITQRFSPAEVARFCEMLDVIAQINFEELEK